MRDPSGVASAAEGPSKRKIIITAAFALLCCALLFSAREQLRYSPFAAERVLEAPSGVFPGKSGHMYIIDDGKKTVLIVGEDGKLERELRAGNDAFYYASLVCEGDDGSVYIADVLYAGEGTRIAAERVFRYGRSSSGAEAVYEIAYADPANAPLQYGRIADMRESGGVLTLAVDTGTGAEIYDVDVKTGAVGDNRFYELSGENLSDLSFHPETGRPVFTTRTGEVGTVDPDGSARALTKRGSDAIPWSVSAEGEYVYYCDLNASALMRVEIAGGKSETVVSFPGVTSFARVVRGTVCATDGAAIYAGGLDGELRHMDAVPLRFTVFRALAWLAVAAAVVLGLALAAAVIRALTRKNRGELFRRVVIAIVVALVVCLLSSYITISRMTEAQSDGTMRQLRLFGEIIASRVDCGLLREIDGADDYGSGRYISLRSRLDELTSMTYDRELYYYYVIYVTDGERIYGVADYEDTIAVMQPVYPYGAEGITEAFEGETVEIASEISSYGAWAFVLCPIFDDGGNVAGVIEVGANLDEINTQRRETVRELALTVASSSVVLVLLMIEGMLLIEHFERRRRLRKTGDVERLPLRSLVFIAYTADSVQDAFAIIYSARLYTPVLGIPRELGAALPLSVQLLAAAAAALVCGRIMRRWSARRAILLGFVLLFGGFALVASVGSYFALLAGKALIGCGIGFVTVSTNAAAADEERENMRAELFAAISAGVIAGVTVGAGVGSVALSFLDFKGVFAVAAAIAALGALLAVFCKQEHQMPAAEKRSEEWRRGGLRGFLANREILGFFILVLMPFMLMLSFRDYFFPLFSAESGISETDIGRIYLLCGVAAIYLGPRLTTVFVGRLGEKRTTILASALAGAAALGFAAVPNTAAAIFSVLLLTAAASFGYAAQSAYYSGLKATARYGESRAMGVYSIFDNAGQIIGPLVYAAAMLAGARIAAGIVGAGLMILLILFVILRQKKEH
jgi:predicted MFS family arabinose efflux permease